MKHTILSAAIAVALAANVAAPAALAASDADFAEMRSALDAVNRRLDALEQQNKALEAKNRQLEERNTKLEEANDRQTDQIAQARARSTSADWASKITWRGDVRYRHEFVDPEEAVNDQTRHRIRARFGLSAKVNDSLNATVQLATNGGNGDPRSTNQTLGQGFDRKGVAIDLAFIDWKMMDGLNLQLGKIAHPYQRVASFFWDGDITPEGAALRFAKGDFFANAYGFWLQEAGTTSDANVVGAQLGIRHKFSDGFTLTGAVQYYDLGAVQNEITTTAGTCTANTTFFGGPQGNTTFTGGGCARLLNDFNVIEALVQADLKVGSLPLVLFANVAQNQEAETLDQAWAGGFTLGRASAPHSWEFGAVYQKTEKDALFGQFVDSDFGGGLTDVEGSVLRVGYAPAQNWVINGTYFLNDRFIDVGTERSYDRWQLDFNVRY